MPRCKSLLRLALLALVVSGFSACGDEPAPLPRAGGSGGGDGSPYGPDGVLLGSKPGAAHRPNLLFVVCEQLRAREAAAVSGGSAFSVDRGDLVICEQAVTPVPEAGAALASLLTARLPSRHRVSHVDPVPRLDTGFVTLPEILRAQGYATRAFVANERLRLGTSLWQGCDVDPGTFGPRGEPHAFTEWITSLPKGTPWAAWIVSDAAVPPYTEMADPDARGIKEWNLAEPFDLTELFLAEGSAYDALRRELRATEGDAAVVAMERRLQRFLWEPREAGAKSTLSRLAERAGKVYVQRALDVDDFVESIEFAARPWRQGTVALYTSTGGTAFREHGIFGAARQLYDEQIRIPLVIDGLEPHGHVPTCVSLVDVLPTVLDVLGLPALPGIDGVSLLPVIREKVGRAPVISEEHQDAENTGDPTMKATLVSVRSAKWKYIVRWDLRAGTVVEEAYDLVADPAEKQNLAAGKPTVEGVPFDAEMCTAIERVRDGIWVSVDGANATADSPYSQGQRVTAGRPRPCRHE